MNPELQTKNHFTQVTILSKALAAMLFIIMPFVGLYIGYTFAPEKVVEVERVVTVERLPQPSVEELFLYEAESGELLISTEERATSSRKVMAVPPGTYMFDQKKLGSTTLFSLQTDLDFDVERGSDYFINVGTVYTYTQTADGVGRIERLFNSNDTDWAYIRVEDVELEDSIWQFSVYGCWECGVHRPQVYLYAPEVRRNNLHNLGQITQFEKTSEREYRYKPYDPADPNLVLECEAYCQIVSDTDVAWITGSF